MREEMTLLPPASLSGWRTSALLGEISAVAASAQLVEKLEEWIEPETAFSELFADHVHAAWLDAGLESDSGWSYLAVVGAAGYVLIGDPDTGSVEVTHPASGRISSFHGSIIDALEAARPPGSVAADGFNLGWVGWLGYESGAASLGVAHAESGRPDSAMLFVDRLIGFDHARRTVEVRTFSRDGAGAEWIRDTVRRLRGISSRQPSTPDDAILLDEPARLRHSPPEYLQLIARCKEKIADGEAYQLCLTNQITVRANVDPLSLYRRLRRLNPTTRGGFVVAGSLILASTSPELFLRISPDGVIVTKPIKGTRPRSADAVEDARLKRELRDSVKEQAENLMIVDLMRNDFSRVASLGSVRVPELFKVEDYRNVFQLVSTVTGELAPERTAVDAVKSAFPAGSMTGAPKLRAMEILGGLEVGPRGAYAGVFGFLAVGGALQLSMTIRTVVIDREVGTATVGTGGGITALSDPLEELDEMLLKASPLLSALGAVLAA